MLINVDELALDLISLFIKAARRPILLASVILAFVASACLCLVLSALVFRGWWQGFFQNLGVSVLIVGVINLGILGALRGLTEGPPRDPAADQDQALQFAAEAAVRLTVEELQPGNAKQAEQLSIVISQVFGEPRPDTLAVNDATVLEALQASIASQLAALDDASLSGTGESAADILGVSGAALAQKVTKHLLQEILADAIGGGPLFPLASQLNHDIVRLEGRQIKAMVGDALERLARLEETMGRLGDHQLRRADMRVPRRVPPGGGRRGPGHVQADLRARRSWRPPGGASRGGRLPVPADHRRPGAYR